MKKCPYCAEEIQDEAIKCRYCMSDLTVAPPQSSAPAPSAPAPASASIEPASTTATTESEAEPASTETDGSPSTSDDAPSETAAPAPASTPSSTWSGSSQTTSMWGTPGQTPQTSQAAPATSSGVAQKYTHSGYRYVLGYGADFFGIWNRDDPSTPTERYPRTDQGWRDAWSKFVQLEPNQTAVPDGASTGAPVAMGAAGGGATTAATATTGGVAPQIQMNPSDTAVLQYTHSGTRYLLGYGQTFFGIWDRQNPTMPVERFPRSDDGWAQAWRRYTQIETNFTEVR